MAKSDEWMTGRTTGKREVANRRDSAANCELTSERLLQDLKRRSEMISADDGKQIDSSEQH
jgi:hypothetical protein